MLKYLDNTGLSYLWGKITSLVSGKADKSEMSVTEGTGNDSDKTTITLKTGTSATVLTSHQIISGKADKVDGAISGNFAGLDSNGNLVDSGYSPSDFATAAQGTLASSAYQLPSGGIPDTDLDSNVRESLALANSALQSNGDNMTGNLVLKSSTTSGDTPYLVFQRGTASDSYYDWKIKNTGGNLKFYESHSGTDTQVLMLSRTTGITASTFNGELDGTISSSTTATTQTSGDNSTKVATTAFVNSAIPTISTSISTDKTSDTKTASPKAVYDEIHPEISNTEPSGGMIPNIMYNFGELTGNTTFTLAAPTNNNIVNHYYFCFDTPSTVPTIVWPSGLTWYGGTDPSITASKHYEISIINNIACYMEV